MATAIINREGDTVATRMFGGRERGAIIQMEITEAEWATFQSVEVSEEGSEDWMPFAAWVATQTATVIWDTAARQHQMAREYETSRFRGVMGEFTQGAAMYHRVRAKAITRHGMRVVR